MQGNARFKLNKSWGAFFQTGHSRSRLHNLKRAWVVVAERAQQILHGTRSARKSASRPIPVPSLLIVTFWAQRGGEPSDSLKCTLAARSSPCANSENNAADSGSGSDHESAEGDREEDPGHEDGETGKG